MFLFFVYFLKYWWWCSGQQSLWHSKNKFYLISEKKRNKKTSSIERDLLFSEWEPFIICIQLIVRMWWKVLVLSSCFLSELCGCHTYYIICKVCLSSQQNIEKLKLYMYKKQFYSSHRFFFKFFILNIFKKLRTRKLLLLLFLVLLLLLFLLLLLTI